MQFISENSVGKYEMTKEQFFEIQEAMRNIQSYLNIMHDYCDCNADYPKISPLPIIIDNINVERKRITDKF